MNQKGNSTLLFMCITLMMTALFLAVASKKITVLKKQKESQYLHLCAKEINGYIKKFILDIESSNFKIKNLYFAHKAALFSGNAMLATILKATIFGLKAKQSFKLGSYMKKITINSPKSCNVSPFLLKTPYVLSTSIFKRNIFDETIFRRKKWSYSVQNKSGFIRNSISIQNKKPTISSTSYLYPTWEVQF